MENLTLPQFYEGYVRQIKEDSLIQALMVNGNEGIEYLRSIPERLADFRYSEGKWSIRQLLIHINDAERVFAYRTLTFARNDKAELPGFDEKSYAEDSLRDNRPLYKIIEEFATIRASTIDLFSSFNEEVLKREGSANGSIISVKALGFVIAGHEIHHRKILTERYLSES